MNPVTALMGLMTETSLHAGAGSSAGVLDLPIQREGHNGWPCVFGSAVKGSLRDLGETQLGRESADLFSLFGPAPTSIEVSDHAGALSVGDARLLLLAIRSLTGSFRWVTCPEALRRFKRDAHRMGLKSRFDFEVPDVNGTDAAVVAGEGGLFLEEYRFETKPDARVKTLPALLCQLIHREDSEAELIRRLVVISDDMFSLLTQNATPVNAHIALDSDTKTVREGALWYEETLPPETLLYVPLMANQSRRQDQRLQANEVMARFKSLFEERPWLQLGGNETVGMGWCAVKLLEAIDEEE